MQYVVDIQIVIYVLLGVFAAAWCYQLYFYLRFILAAVRRTKPQDDNRSLSDAPGVSVIVCARNEEANIRDYLQSLMTQDYPTYEVIVVNDGSVDHSRELLEYWEKRYSNLRLTFVPQGAKVGSTKKLAITLGAKAAQYDYLLLTDADCRPESTHWIAEMMQGFRGQPMANGQQPTANSQPIDIVLGFGAYFCKRSLLNRLIQFDTLFVGLQYLGMAASGYPYMGVGRNLAYSKRLFFAHGGFRGLMDQRAGDDDLLVNREATAQNTAVVCTPESLTWSVPKLTWREWFRQKRRHLSVSHDYRTATKCRLLLEPLTRGLLYAALIAIIVLCALQLNCEWANGQMANGSWAIMWPAVAAIAAMLVRWIGQCVLLNIAASRWGTTKTILLLPVWEVFLPLVTLTLMLIEPLRPKPSRW